MATPTAIIDATGVHIPTFATVLTWVNDQFRAIYGTDVSLDASTQDGELCGIFASAINDTNAMAVQAYNSFSPTTSQGSGLSSVVKINGLQRLVSSFSSADILIVGQAGSLITAGLIADGNSNTWALPPVVVIPDLGQILVTALCTTLGAISAPAGTITQVANLQPGWQTASNPQDATLGAPVETDALLRLRQSISTANGSTGMLQGMVGSLAAIPGVARVRGYENELNLPDANGIPGHCVAIVIDGGDAQTIARTIKAKKGGCGTYGSTSQIVTDVYGIPSTVNFFPVGQPLITFAITIKALTGFTTDVELLIKTALSAWVNALGIGVSLQRTRSFSAAYLFGGLQSQTFEIATIAIARDGLTPTQNDVTINFNEAAFLLPANVTIIVSNP